MSKEYYSVIRVLDKDAVIECPDKTLKTFPLSYFPFKIIEGNILVKDINGKFIIDKEEETKRKKYLLDLQNSILNKS